MKLGTILSIHIATRLTEQLSNVDQISVVAGQGLAGDRYYAHINPSSGQHDAAKEATFIEAETLEALQRDFQIDLTGPESRRNFTTRGVALNHLVGKEFRVGEAVFRGIRLCEPCTHLEEITGKQAREALIHRGGLRAQIVQSGVVCVGDEISAAS